MSVGVVTDSASDLPAELASSLGIIVVPLEVRLGADVLAPDLSPEEFWKVAGASAALPETAAPSPGAFAAAFSTLAAAGADGVICVTISSALSATYEAARQAASAVASEVAVEVIDSQTVTMGEGLLVLEAAAQAATGASLAEVTEAVRSAIATIEVFGTLDTLDNLRRGGRIGGAAAFIGSLLQVKPVVEVRDGVVEGESRQRTRARSLRYLADKVAAAGPLRRLAVVHAAASDLNEINGLLAGISPEQPLVVSYIGPVVGAHTGLGTIGVCFQRT